MFNLKTEDMALHSTYEVRWKNFKGFKDTGWRKIKPITILIGANNSGKTSFISPLLLMSQTITSRDSTSPLIVQGSLFDGGSMKELAHNYNTDEEMFLGFRYHVHEQSKKKIKKVGNYPPGAFEITIGKNPNPKRKSNREFEVKKHTVYDMYLREYLTIEKDKNFNYKLSGAPFEILDHERDFIKEVRPINFLFSPNTFLQKIRKDVSDETTSNRRFSKGYEELLRVISHNWSMTRGIISDISYLGPLRDSPHRFYIVSNEDYKTVGLKGERTPNLLKKYIDGKGDELNERIKKFQFGDQLLFKKISEDDLLYAIYFKDNKSQETNIANTGFGASQILPLIVQAIASDEESITIAEQPEIHLNPKLQGELAELFCYMANKDQRVIIETHSEHLLMRLRTLVAKGSIKADMIAVYFIEKNKGESTIKEISIDNDGSINPDQWPDDFFDDTLRESLALAAQQAQNRKN